MRRPRLRAIGTMRAFLTVPWALDTIRRRVGTTTAPARRAPRRPPVPESARTDGSDLEPRSLVTGWVIFIATIVVVLALDLLVLRRRSHEVRMREALTWCAVWIGLALAFNGFV